MSCQIANHLIMNDQIDKILENFRVTKSQSPEGL